MRPAFRILASLTSLAVVVQVGFAGYGAFNAIDKADNGQSVTKETIENGFDPHGFLGTIVIVLMLVLLIVALVARHKIRIAGLLFGLGIVEVGRDVQHDELLELYDAVVYAVGAQTDRRLGIPGEDLPGSWAATEFVAWYNGHPDFQHLEFDLTGERAVVIGNGNVAVDVARMLALTPEELAPTDTTDAGIDAFTSAGIREIVMVGRRGPAQAAFTTPELQELGELAGADVIVDPGDLDGAEPKDTNAERNLAVLREYAAREPAGKPKRLVLRFLTSPVAIVGEERVEAIELVRNRLEVGASGATRAVATDELETLPAGIVFRSVGYRGVALPGVPFDEDTGTIPNDRGRVSPGVYVTGWIKRGPTGVIGTNKKDATETVQLVLEDLRDAPRKGRSAEEVEARLLERGVRLVVYAGW